MPETLYDTRFFITLYAVKESSLKKKLKLELETRKRRFASAITIHEIYRLALQDEGRDVAKLRKSAIQRDFEIISVDAEIAAQAAEIKVAQGKDFPLADALIGATAILHKLECFSDDQHIKSIQNIKTRWV